MGTLVRSSIVPDPRGSRLFPEDVIMEEALEQLDRIWDSQWHGEGINTPYSREVQEGGEPLKGDADSGKKTKAKGELRGVPRFFRRLKQTLQTLTRRGSESKEALKVEASKDSMMTDRVPQFPSWVQWSECRLAVRDKQV